MRKSLLRPGTRLLVVVFATFSWYLASAPTVQAAIKWNPGHYMFHRSFDQQTRFKAYDKLDFRNNRYIKGAMVSFTWSQLEGNIQGDYADGIALVRKELEYLKNLKDANGKPAPKRLILRVWEKHYSNNSITNHWYFPKYLNTSNMLFTAQNRDLQWKRYDSEAMGWFISMLKAYAREFDGDTYLEMICPFQETSFGTNNTRPPISDYTTQKEFEQHARLARELKVAWPHTNVWIPTNWTPYSRMSEYIGYLRSIGVGAGNPDTSPIYAGNIGQYADRILRGEIGGVDYRGTMLISFAVESSSMGWDAVGPVGGFTAKEIYKYVNDVMRVSHMGWERNNDIGTNEQRWYVLGTTNPGGILNVINSHPLSNTACPTAYVGKCVSGTVHPSPPARTPLTGL